MKKSKHVPATFVAGLAAAVLAGCSGSGRVRQCVDRFGNPVPDIECRQATSSGVVIGHWGYAGGGGYSGGRGGGFIGGGGGGVGVGVSGNPAVSRGGFGGAAGGFGGGFGAG